jgi:DNA polymerase IV (DinB-like DNA polymerase)
MTEGVSTAGNYPDLMPVSGASAPSHQQERIILHLDMDIFYASVEMRDRPEIRGRPVVIGADPKGGKGRGVVSTCSYEARVYGIRSAMPISTAYTLCPHAIFLPPDFQRYGLASLAVMEILKESGIRFQQVSIDEAYLDLSPCGSFTAAAEYARSTKERIWSATGLSCSIGIAPSKIVAKIASDYKKPGGLTVITPGEVRAFLSPMPARKIPGIGRKSETILLEMGIRTIGDLAGCDPRRLIGRFGRGAGSILAAATGADDGVVCGDSTIKSISREVTFEEDTADQGVIGRALEDMLEDLCRNLCSEHLRCRTITIKIRYQGFVTRTKAKTLSHSTGGIHTIRSTVRALAGEVIDGRKVRLIGIRLSSFDEPDPGQGQLGC